MFLIVNLNCSFAINFFVSPNGSSSGKGTVTSPWDLQTALNHPLAVQPGDTIWLRGGLYSGNFTSNLNGAVNQYIYVLQYPGERAIVQDNRQFASGATLQVNGSWTIYQSFEITNSNPDRKSTNSSSFRPMGLQVVAPHTKLINLIIHDVGHGIGFWKEAVDAEVYGCIIYNCGIYNKYGVYSTHGHGIYTQNDSGIKTIKHNIIFNQFGFGIHAYPNPGHVNGFVIDGNTIFNNGILTNDSVRYNNILVNSYAPYTCKNITVKNNLTYDSKNTYKYTSIYEADVLVGATNMKSSKLLMHDNYFMGKGRAGQAVLNWDSVIYKNNTSYYHSNGSVAIALPSGGVYAQHDWNNNLYYGPASLTHFSYQFGPLVNFQNWKSTTNFDANSLFISAQPDSNNIFIFPNQYEKGRANVIVYNWSNKTSVTVDLSKTGLVAGQAFKVYDAQNYGGDPVYEGNYDTGNATIAIGFSSLNPVAPLGLPAIASTAPEFVTLVVVPGLPQINAINDQNTTLNQVEIFPNPTTGLLHFKINTTVGFQVVKIALYDFVGMKIFEKEENFDGILRYELPVGQFTEGNYLLKLSTSDGVITKRIQIVSGR
jgi:hypothetical protein